MYLIELDILDVQLQRYPIKIIVLVDRVSNGKRHACRDHIEIISQSKTDGLHGLLISFLFELHLDMLLLE